MTTELRSLLILCVLICPVGLVGCQDGTRARERPPVELDGTVATPIEEGAPPQTQCRASARFGLSIGQTAPDGTSIDAGTAWASGGESGSTDVWATTDQFVVGLQHPQPAATRPYAGTMTITWTANGQAVSATSSTSPAATELRVRGVNDTKLWEEFVQVDREWRGAGRAFRFAAPAAPAVVVVTALAVWRTDDGQTCRARTSFNLRWLAPEAMTPFPADVPLPVPFARDVLVHQEDDRRRHVAHSGVYVVTPIRYVWSVESTTRCCGVQSTYRVIQFARAVLESEVSQLRRRRPWGLDVAQSQKDDANDGKPFDPGLTQRPGERDTQMNSHPGSAPAVSHWDGPGMSEVRYRQLLLTPGRHVFRQQFLSLLACGSLRNSRANQLLDSYRIVKAVAFTLTWTFEGPVGDPGRVHVRSEVNDAEPMACKTLREVLDANRLMQAFLRPGPAELERSDLLPDELQSVQNFSIAVPP